MLGKAESLPDSGMLHHRMVQFFQWLDKWGKYGRPFFALLMGCLLSRAFAPVNFFPAVFIVFPACLLLIDQARSGAAAFSAGWWFGLGLFAMGLNWVGYSFTQQDHVPAFLAPFAVFALAAILALYLGLVFWVTWRLSLRGFHRILAFAAMWLLMEVARGIWFTGFPWHLVGSLWAEWLLVAQLAYWTGVHGLSFLTILVAGSLAVFCESGRVGRWRLATIGALLALFPMVAAGGMYRLQTNTSRFHLAVSLRLVQANIPQKEKWISYLMDSHFDNHLQLSRGSGKNGKADGIKLLVWPETAVHSEEFDREGSLLRWRVSRLLNFGSYAVVGAPRFEKSPDGIQYYNSLIALNAKGDLYARYDKHHLVPFGEYLPFESWLQSLGLSQLTGGASFAAGTELATISLPGVPPFSPLICYESIFSGQVIRQEDRPEWMLNISNDAWFGTTEGPYQHLAQARLRAIEEGLPLVRSTGTGISAVIDAYGRTVTSLGLNRKGLIESPLPASLAAPPVATPIRILALTLLCGGIIVFYLLQAVRLFLAGRQAA